MKRRRRARRPPRQRDQARATRSAATFRPAHPDEIARRLGPPGFIGPVGDRAADPARRRRSRPAATSTGANQPDLHLRGVEPGRDFPFEPVDVRTVVAGDTIGGATVRIEPAIEVGNIFKLGTRYSEPLGATYLDESGKEQLIWMGSYGIGPARAAAAAVEQFADEQGISWPRSIAPFDVELVVLGQDGTDERALAEGLYARAARAGAADALRRPRRRAGREVRRRRAARLPAAADGRPPDARGRRDRGADPPRPGGARGADRRRGGGGRGAVAGASVAVPVASRRERRSLEAPPVRDRPLRAAARRRRSRGTAAPVDDPERDRLRCGWR